MPAESPSFSPQNNHKKEARRFHIEEEVEQLRSPAKNILGALRDNIERGSYQLIIGDDASGRNPALLLNRVIQDIYQEKGYELPKILFFAGSKQVPEEEKPEKIKRISDFLTHGKDSSYYNFDGVKKVLIVTDFIETGASLDPIVSALQGQGIDFDVASISGSLEERWGKTIFYGSDSDSPPLMYGKDSLSGVYKNNKNSGDIFSKPTAGNLEGIMDKKDVNKNVADTREDVALLADELTKWYNADSKN